MMTSDSESGGSNVRGKIGGFFSEFWAFTVKGNAIQLAVAVVLGGAFSAVVNALVNNIITPFITLATHNVDFKSWGYTLRSAQEIGGTTTPAVIVGYGPLLQAIINFIIVGLSIFLIYKIFSGMIRRMQRREEEEQKAAPPDPISKEEKLLGEIRDLLKEQSGSRKQH